MTGEVVWRPLLYLDANVFIDAYQGGPSFSEPARLLLDRLRRRPGAAITSELSLAEVLVNQRGVQRRAYLDLMIWSRCVDLVPITRDLLYLSTDLRGVHVPKLRLADSIHLATAIANRCGRFISRDGGIAPPLGMRRMQPDQDGVDAILDGGE